MRILFFKKGAQVSAILEHHLRDTETGEVLEQQIEEVVEGMRKLHQGDQKYLVAHTPDGAVLGIVGLTKPNNATRLSAAFTTQPIEMIIPFAHPDHVAEGVGRKLVEAAERTARRLGFMEVLSNVAERFSDFNGFLEHMGYKPMGTFPNFYRDGQQATTWSKIIAR